MRQKTVLGALGILSIAALVFASSYPFYHAVWKGTGSRHNTIEFSINTPSAGSAAIFAPGTDNTNALGSSSLRFSDLRTVLATISGTATMSGNATVGGTAAITGALTASTATFSGGLGLWRQATPDASLTPTTTGQLVINTTSGDVCMSTGIGAGAWVLLRSTGTACQN